jgi:hypothetical protein
VSLCESVCEREKEEPACVRVSMRKGEGEGARKRERGREIGDVQDTQWNPQECK